MTAFAEFSLTDAALGDDTGDDGVIVDQGGPGIPTASATVPTLSDWGRWMLLLSLGFLAFRHLKRAGGMMK